MKNFKHLLGLFILVPFVLLSCYDMKNRILIKRNIHYSHNGKNMQGYLAFDQKDARKRPGILLIHEWTGLGEYVKKRTEMLAALGYTVFAMDMYGKGIRAKDHEEANSLMQKYLNDPDLMMSRIRKALKILRDNPLADPEKIAVIGYCFGGGAAISLALTGEDINGVVSFHGVLNPPSVKEAKSIKTKLLIHHGAEDSFISAKDLKKFKKNLKKTEVNFEFVSHEGAVHGFTRWSAGDDKSTGVAYHKEADIVSWESMKKFLKRIF